MSTNPERAMIGTFESSSDARHAIEDLRAARFSDRRIGVLMHDKDGDPEVRSFRALEGNRAAPGAALGAAAGAGVGAMWGIGVAAGFLPAVGPIIAGGMLLALAASAISGAAAGVLVGTLIGLGVTDVEAAFYDAEFKKGHTILVVQANHKRRDLVHTIFKAHAGRERLEWLPGTLAEQIEAHDRSSQPDPAIAP